jgi:AraC-like DNA-binding protein
MGQYVRALRVQQSMVELSRSEATLAEISAALGFADQSHFSRIFKSHTGMTPGEYRRIKRRSFLITSTEDMKTGRLE